MASAARERSIGHVLLCLDGSQLAEACVPHALSVASAFGAKMTLLHVMASTDAEYTAPRLDALDWEIKRREAERYLSRIQHALEDRGVARDQLASQITQGRPTERIVALAHEFGSNLTVLASHGEGNTGPFSLGSTAQQVLTLAPGSLLVIPTRSDANWTAPAKRIVVGVDGSVRSQSMLPEVARFARFHGAAIALVHVVGEPKPTEILSEEEDLALARKLAACLPVRAEAYLARLRDRFFGEVAEVESLVLRHPDKRRALLDAATQQRADLLVLAAHGATCDAERPFGSVTAYALSNAKLPLLVLQDLPSWDRDGSRLAHASERTRPRTRGSFGARQAEEA